MRDCGFGALRQDNGDAVAATDTKRRERIRKPVRLLLQIPECVRCGGARLILPVHRKARTIHGMATADSAGDVEVRRHLPAVLGTDLLITVDRHEAMAAVMAR